LIRFVKRHAVGIAVWVAILAGWEVAAHAGISSQLQGSPIVPSWEFVFTTALKGLSGSWTLHFLAPNPAIGGEPTYLGAFAAIVYHSLLTLYRLILGLLLGVAAGIGSGFALSYWRWMRELFSTPMNLLRMMPLLAAIPLFQFWLGATTVGTTLFIGFGVWVLLFVTTSNAVRNVDDRYVESARTLGASRFRSYVTVVMPAALPELRTALLLAGGLSWSLAIGAEYLGMPTGLGSIMATAESFTNTGRMMIIAILIIAYALVTFAVLDWVFGRAVRWMPRVDVEMEMAVSAAAIAGNVGTRPETR